MPGMDREAAVRQALYIHAAQLLHSGGSPEQTQAKLVESGLDQQTAAETVHAIVQAQMAEAQMARGEQSRTAVGIASMIVGTVLFLAGIGLYLGNKLGLLPTFPFAGFIVSGIGGALVVAGEQSRSNRHAMSTGTTMSGDGIEDVTCTGFTEMSAADQRAFVIGVTNGRAMTFGLLEAYAGAAQDIAGTSGERDLIAASFKKIFAMALPMLIVDPQPLLNGIRAACKRPEFRDEFVVRALAWIHGDGANDTIFYKNDCLGEFQGDILEALAPNFPPAMAKQIRRHPPVRCKWRVFKRITWQGGWGHHFDTEQAACDAFNGICDGMYEARHKPPGYRGFYNENTEAEGLPSVCIQPGHIVIWQPGKVEIPKQAEPDAATDGWNGIQSTGHYHYLTCTGFIELSEAEQRAFVIGVANGRGMTFSLFEAYAGTLDERESIAASFETILAMTILAMTIDAQSLLSGIRAACKRPEFRNESVMRALASAYVGKPQKSWWQFWK